MEKQKNYTCPSYAAKPGVTLFGIINKAGTTDYLQKSIEVDDSFINKASEGRTPEKRFRFAGKCAKSGCKQWSSENSECGLIETIISVYDKPEQKELGHCDIRPTCRWYKQRKGLACAQCNEVIRNIEATLCG